MTILTRRKFLAATGITAAGAATIGAPRYLFAAPGSPNTGDTIIVVFLRGGADGLHIAAPVNYPSYGQLRGNIALNNTLPLNQNSSPNANINIDVLELHPRMEALYNGLWAEGKCAIIPAVGIDANSIPDGQRGRLKSHFEAERFSEKGSGSTNVNNGWLARLVEAQGVDSAVGSIRKTKGDSVLLNGTEVVSINDLESLSTDGGLGGFRDGDVARPAIEQMVSGNDSISQNGQRALQSITSLEDLDPNELRPNYPNNGFGQALAEVATVLRAGVGLQAAAIDFGGWDHHEGINNRFGDRIEDVCQGIQQLAADTNGLEEVTVIVTTEFGRTVRSNGKAGTDHGRARTELIMGAGITGGVYGDDYPDALNDNLDGLDRNALPVLTDYRKVLAEIASARADVANVDAVTPGYDPGALLGFT